jgi:hypothetical protein
MLFQRAQGSSRKSLRAVLFHFEFGRVMSCLLTFVAFALWTACSGISISGSAPKAPTPPSQPQIVVTMSPTSATVAEGGLQQFTAKVTGTTETGITWSATAGTISTTGLFTVPKSSSATNAVVTATSVADHKTTATASVSITPPKPPAPLAIQTSSLATVIIGSAYSERLSATGGEPPYQWHLASGVLPSGFALDEAAGTLSGTTETTGQFSFELEVNDAKSNAAQRSLDLQVVDASACQPPAYGCARNDTAVIPLPTPLPDWGGLRGANTIFTDPSFSAQYPPKYVRVTDANTYLQCNPALTNTGFVVTTGSGDEAILNADDSLFLFADGGTWPCIFGLNQTTMQTGFVYQGLGNISPGPAWSQSNPQYLYDLDITGGLYLATMVDSEGQTCHLGGPECTPSFSQFYNFVTNCNVNPSVMFIELAGVGGNDTVFGATFAVRAQDTGHQVVAYNSVANTCYFYNTQAGTVRSYVGTQAPITGTVTCNNTTAVSYNSGTPFDPTWTGLNITIAGATYVVRSVASSHSLTLYSACPTASSVSYSTEPGTLLGATTSSDRYSVHNVKIDPSGTWMVVVEGSNCYSTTCNVVHAWKIGTTTVNNCVYQTDGGSDAGRCDGHWTENATGWLNGSSFSTTTNPSMQLRTWDNFSTTNSADVTELNTGDATPIDGFDIHPSNKNDPLGTHGYPILTSTYAPEMPQGAINYPYSNEIIGWSQSGGPVYRFGHTFNSSLMPPSCCFPTEYAIGAPSSTGQFYIFTTDGEGTLGNSNGNPTCSISEGTCRSDIFILSLSPK